MYSWAAQRIPRGESQLGDSVSSPCAPHETLTATRSCASDDPNAFSSTFQKDLIFAPRLCKQAQQSFALHPSCFTSCETGGFWGGRRGAVSSGRVWTRSPDLGRLWGHTSCPFQAAKITNSKNKKGISSLEGTLMGEKTSEKYLWQFEPTSHCAEGKIWHWFTFLL